jgi:formyl-CoA transferase
VTEDEQMFASGAFVPLVDGPPEIRHTVDSPLRIEGETKAPARMAPDLGQHTAEVLAELGYDEAAVAKLKAAGALG